MSTLMISISGVRGIVGDSLTPDVALNMSASFASIAPEGEILVATDGRTSGDMLKSACITGLAALGRQVTDLGVCTTPSTGIAVTSRGAAGAIICTASHNPSEWNGLKFLDPQGLFLRQHQLDALIGTWKNGAITWKSWDAMRPVERWDGAAAEHIDRILALDVVDVAKCREASIPVVLDTINASGGAIAPHLLERLGCRVTHVNADIHGRFGRMPEPLPENIASVGETVVSEGAAIGLVLDPDSDRLALLDETGRAIGEEYTLALAVRSIRSRKPHGPVVVNVSTSRMVDDIGAELGFDVIRTPVGEINVVQGMLDCGATLGGEGNGGVIYGDLHYGRDGILGIALIIDLLAREGATLSELCERIPKYTIVKTKAAVDPNRLQSALAAFKQLAEDKQIVTDTCDGVKLIWPDRWLHVRPSNTEPVVRTIAEAPTADDAQDLCDLAKSILETVK